MAGNFQDGSIPGKIQFGKWLRVTTRRRGSEWQLNALSNIGLLRRFVGMVTDSRSFPLLHASRIFPPRPL